MFFFFDSLEENFRFLAAILELGKFSENTALLEIILFYIFSPTKEEMGEMSRMVERQGLKVAERGWLERWRLIVVFHEWVNYCFQGAQKYSLLTDDDGCCSTFFTVRFSSQELSTILDSQSNWRMSLPCNNSKIDENHTFIKTDKP